MPEHNEDFNLEQRFEQEMSDSHDRFGRIFDRATQEHRSPIEIIREETNDFKGLRRFHGDVSVEEMITHLPEVPENERESFIAAMTELVKPMVHSGVFDPEIRARVDDYRRLHKTEIVLTAPVDQPHLEMRIYGFEITKQSGDSDERTSLRLPDGTELKNGDPVMEISWPNEGPAPTGIKGVKDALYQMALTMNRRPEIKALMLTSWMASRSGVMKKMGFHVMLNEPIEEGRISKTVEWGQKGRADKPYQREVTRDDVKLAVMSRDEFLTLYGST